MSELTTRTIRDLFHGKGVRYTATLARKLGIPDTELARIRRGDALPRLRGYGGNESQASKLARFFGISVDELLDICGRSK